MPANRSLLVALSVTLGLTACFDEPTPKQTNLSQTATKPNPKNLTINNASEPETLDPHLASGVQDMNVIRQFGEGLVSTDNDGNLVPGMASEWSSPDNKVWTFKLRDAKWSNGDAVTAHDFVYSFRRLIDPATAADYASYLVDAKITNAADILAGRKPADQLGVVALDDKTLQISLSEPVPYFVQMLTHTSTFAVHQKTLEQFGDKWTAPENIVVNGPFIPSQWVVNEKIVLTKNPAYYQADSVKLDSLTILPIASATTDVLRYQAGEVDITASELPSEQFAGLKSSLGNELKTAPVLCTYFYDLNHAKPPFDDPRVRKALALALDRHVITDQILGQGQMPAYQFTPTFIAGKVTHTPDWQNWDKSQRIAEAKRLLNEAGFDENHPLSFELLYDTNESHKKIAVAASSMWQQNLGFVKIDLVNQEWKTYLDNRRNGNFQMVRARWCGDYNEPSTFLNLMRSDNTNNWSRFNSSDYDKLMASTVDPKLSDEQRLEHYRAAEALLDKNQAHIDVFYYANVRLVKPHVQGYSNANPLDYWQAKYWSIKTN